MIFSVGTGVRAAVQEMAEESEEEKQATSLQAKEFLASKREPIEADVLPLQSMTVYPETLIPLAVGRPRSVSSVESALSKEEKLLACFTVRPDETTNYEAQPSDLYPVGTLVLIKRMERVKDVLHLIVQGIERIRLVQWQHKESRLQALVEVLPEVKTIDADKVEATKRNLQEMIKEALTFLPNLPPEVRTVMLGAAEPVRLTYFLGSILHLGVEQEQKLLEANTSDELLSLANRYVLRELKIIRLRAKIAEEAQHEIDKEQRTLILRHQVKGIQKRLAADVNDTLDETEQLEMRSVLLKQLEAIKKELGEEES